MDDASLDEFLGDSEGDGGDGDDTTDGGAGGDEASADGPPPATPPEQEDDGSGGRESRERPDGTDADGGRVNPASVDPAATTYAWSGAATCADCGTEVTRRWRQDGRLVCPDCKEW